MSILSIIILRSFQCRAPGKLSSARETVELFHLLFLDHFGRKTDKNLYALKGGGNLRFFHGSPRYSQDIDLDVHIIGKQTLANKVDRILESAPFQGVLRSHGLEMSDISKSKQTETTQRWKLAIVGPRASLAARTKIEFSHRPFDDGVRFESINPALVSKYRLSPILTNHYGRETAYAQKVVTLASRPQTQARDVFDLDLLLRSGVTSRVLKRATSSKINQAVTTAMSVTFEDFKGQVIAYLEPEHQSQYNSKQVWEEIILRVVNALRGVKT